MVIFRLFVILPAACVSMAQTFGGSPPWGPEKPVPFQGEIRTGAAFAYPIGGDLAVKLVPAGGVWEIDVGPLHGREDYANCVNPPFHGPNPREIMASQFTGEAGPVHWGTGEKRWVDFVLDTVDEKLECQSLEVALRGDKSDWGTRAAGRCWVRPLSVRLAGGAANAKVIDTLRFDGECALHGAWELWRLPATYVIPPSFTGWVTVYYRQKDKSALPREDNRYVLRVAESAGVYTSSDLRQDDREARFVRPGGQAISTEGDTKMIWDWQTGDTRACAPFQSFFVGTGEQYRKVGQNPALRNPAWDCSRVLRVEQQ
jgi:hypothetical protein